jgi:predicted lipoprotein with Yx(FWY)xxD motif
MRTHPTRSWLGTGVLLLVVIAASASGAAKPPAPGYIGGKTVLVKVEQVNGTSRHVLTTHGGMTLYYDTRGAKDRPACTGSCTKTWKPFLLVDKGRPTGRPGIFRRLGYLHRTGYLYQVEYNGHPLYTYSKDARPGEARGAGRAPFHVATMSTPPTGSGGTGGAGS